MRVAFDKEDARLLPIRRRVELEEDQIVGREEEHDLLISRRDLGQSDVPVFGVTTALPVEALGYSLTSEKEYDFFLTKVFDGGWGEEVYVGIPVKGLMNEDCGVGVNSAVWVAGVAEDSTDRFNFERLNEFFMPPMLVDTLVHMNYAGFVSILVNSADSSLRVFRSLGYLRRRWLSGDLGAWRRCLVDTPFRLRRSQRMCRWRAFHRRWRSIFGWVRAGGIRASFIRRRRSWEWFRRGESILVRASRGF